ncbi:MAG: PIN domain-containing protein [Nitrospiraceae bacterium]|nr:PIN domain-containing protein [Nitrospiraceae bacterium]
MHKAFVDTSVILRILLNDDELKRKASEKLIKEAKNKGISLYLLPVAVMEIVFVLEKVYKLKKHDIQQLVTALLNTPELSIEMEDIFRKAIDAYAEKNIKFADALMAFWGMERGLTTIFTYDEKDFKRLQGLEARKP